MVKDSQIKCWIKWLLVKNFLLHVKWENIDVCILFFPLLQIASNFFFAFIVCSFLQLLFISEIERLGISIIQRIIWKKSITVYHTTFYHFDTSSYLSLLLLITLISFLRILLSISCSFKVAKFNKLQVLHFSFSALSSENT